jgi:hypothetical protein
MPRIDDETLKIGRKWLERIRKDLEAKGTRCRNPYREKKQAEVALTEPMHSNTSSFLDEI